MRSLEKAWYKGAKWLHLLLPLSWIYRAITAIRRPLQQRAAAAVTAPVPIVVIGNISVGGTGKTPLLIWLCQALQAAGYHPGVISRGYGGEPEQVPLVVDANTDPAAGGDEPVLIAQQCQIPVVVDPERLGAYRYLVNNFPVDVVLADDGLQHYRLPRHVEVIVVDGVRLFGNGFCLPAGPLREPTRRLRQADLIVVNGRPASLPQELAEAFIMDLQPGRLVNLKTGEQRSLTETPFKAGEPVQAIAGIGNPERFFAAIRRLPHPVSCYAFPDHHAYEADDFSRRGIDPGYPIVMTEKDGIKCRAFATENFWVAKADVTLPEEFAGRVQELLGRVTEQQQDETHAG
jgi:tetraacyldisaccharide 4'-kinase